jgi:MOSC domain-containing protein YiiM
MAGGPVLEGVNRLVSIQVGRPVTMRPTGDGAPWDRIWETGFVKQPIAGPVLLGREGLAGDGQADQGNHGGPNRALLAYSAGHYPGWREELGLPEMGPGGFGENLTIEGQDELTVCVGDLYELGEAVVEVSQPRIPCYKISWRWRRAELLPRVEETGRYGWHLRVRREGAIEAGQSLSLVERPYPQWTVRRVSDVFRARPRDLAAAAELAACAALSEKLRGHLEASVAEGGRVA